MVCLEDCEDVIGSTWLHPRPSAPVEGTIEDTVDECGVSACAMCLKTYFTVSFEACTPQTGTSTETAGIKQRGIYETFAKCLRLIRCGRYCKQFASQAQVTAFARDLR